MQKIRAQNVDIILQNILKLINGNKDDDLAALFKVKSGTISAWRKRNTMNYEDLITICRENEWDINQIVEMESTNHANEDQVTYKTLKPESMNTHPNQALIELIIRKDEELKRIAEELGATKEQLRALKKQFGK